MNETTRGQGKMSESDYVKSIHARVGRLEDQLSQHVKDDKSGIEELKVDVGTIKGTMVTKADLIKIVEELTTNKVKIGIMFSVLAIGLTSLWGWVLQHMSKIT